MTLVPRKSGMIDERARLGFADARGYDTFRPGYPVEAIRFLRRSGRLDERSTVVDLGAGTGLMTQALLPASRLIAVEPLPEMRAELRRRVPEAEVLAGAAEVIPLPSGVADAVVSAQAFHWFASLDAVREIARVLTEKGALFLVWNVRDDTDPSMAAIGAVLAPLRTASPGFASTPWRAVFRDSPLALTVHRTFRFEESLTLERLQKRILTSSYVARLASPARADVLMEIERELGPGACRTAVIMRYRTEVFVARRRRR
jgi:SAM-dependent methyltransferase